MNLSKGVRTIGSALFLITLGLYIAYLVLVEDFRHHILEELYGIAPCSFPPIDTFTDVAFEYSIIANLLVVVACVGCTRWLLIPWLVVYLINSLVLVCLSIFLFSVPFPLLHSNMEGTIQFQMLRFLGFIPLILALLILYCWLVVRGLFVELGSPDKTEEDPCCPMKMKTGVQIMGGILAILSGVFLVIFFAKLDEIISDKYNAIFSDKLSRSTLTWMAGAIVLAIFCNILVILGGSGKRWRRTLLLPWLLFYGSCVIICILTHLYFTSLCWREEKIIGMVSLGVGLIFLVLWSLVWIVAAEAAEKPKTLISRPNPLGFQRL